MAARKKTKERAKESLRERRFSQGDFDPDSYDDEMLDIMSEVAPGLMSNRDLDLSPMDLAILAGRVSETMLASYEEAVEEADFDEDVLDEHLFPMFLRMIGPVLMHASSDDLRSKRGHLELAETCVEHLKAMWQVAASASSDEDDDEDEEGDE